MSDAVAFRGLGEGEAQRLRELLLDDKPLSEHAGTEIECCDGGPYLGVSIGLRRIWADDARMVLE